MAIAAVVPGLVRSLSAAPLSWDGQRLVAEEMTIRSLTIYPEETKMQREVFHPVVIVSCIALVCLAMGLAAESAKAEETEILKITVGKPTKLSDLVNQNTASLMVSRTGVVAAFYPKPSTGPKFYRVSTDGGHTWSSEMNGPPELVGGQNSGALFPGGPTGVIMPATGAWPSTNYTRAKDWKGDRDPNTENPAGLIGGRYDAIFLRFADDMLSWTSELASYYVPNHILALGHIHGPVAAKGKIIQMPDGESLLMPMYGSFEGDDSNRHRSYLVRSHDQGKTWSYYATIDYTPEDPNPELPGRYLGSCEPSIELLPNGQMLAMLRTQFDHHPGEYRPMYVSWSDDFGKTWTKPISTKPHLMNISPTLQVLDNGVVACQYGRPGFHIAFSLDNGHTWQDRVSFSHLPCGVITGQFDMIKVGPNRLLTVGNDFEGTKVWPLTVDRVKVLAATHGHLHGRVLDGQDHPIANATIERSPNRYTAADWLEDRTKSYPGVPILGYRSIQKQHGYPTVKSDAEGRFEFHDVALGEYVLTVEADGYAPQHRHINIRPQSQSQEFQLNPGRLVRSKVMDETGRGSPGICVVLNQWHVHTDSGGYFHWSLEDPAPSQQVALRVYKRYSGQYEGLETTVTLLQLESEPITLKNR